MQLVSVNIGQVRDMIIAKSTTKTGIYKESVSASVFVSKDGLKGDTIGNTKYHGGIDQAVYIYGSKDYDWWKENLGKKISLGLGIFWAIRLFIQFFVYSSDLWKGKKLETSIHILFSIFWTYFSSIFLR